MDQYGKNYNKIASPQPDCVNMTFIFCLTLSHFGDWWNFTVLLLDSTYIIIDLMQRR